MEHVSKRGQRFISAAGLLAVIFLWVSSSRSELLPQGKPEIGIPAAQPQQSLPAFEALARELSPAVVNIAVEGGAEKDPGDESAPPEQPEHPFFRQHPQGGLRSVGSGFVVEGSGYIVTNNHVIENAKRIVVRLLDDKTEYPAELIGRDEKTDLALIKINAGRPLKAAMAGNSDDLQVGEWVLAIGNQFQLGQTVTAGIVSAKGRRFAAQITGPYDNFIQTDASINPGSSGGPLFNRFGQVVGITTAIFSPGRTQFGGTGFNIGIGFAIPVNLARVVLNQLQAGGRVVRGVLGVIIQGSDADLAGVLKLPSPDGALVAEILPGSPAAQAGFAVKDVIVEYNGTAVREHEDLPLLVANTAVGSKVPVKVLRGGRAVVLEPVIAELKPETFEEEGENDLPRPNRLGVVAEDIAISTAALLKLPGNRGVAVVAVEAGSPADKVRVVRGDVILEFNNHAVGSVAELEALLKKAPADQPLLLYIKRRNGARFLTIRLTAGG